MGNFDVIAAATLDRLDPEVYREVGSIVGSYITEPVDAVFTAALKDVLAEPMDPSQLLNTAVGFANAVALVALSVTQDEQAAARVVRETLHLGTPVEDPVAQTLILRMLEPMQSVPDELTGQTLIAIAHHGDMGVRLTDQLNIARQTLAAAVSAAAARVR
ncbi:MAG: hypothetical protein H6524_04890 [Actinobacteria bacterium]|nr:hypothetical protein [Micrococcales bacterium]MCB0903725.1 hypothetical protein [Actinomycetota bacterium]MCO5299536.1 hypothetical protein [Candidatus Nanopelagicales bacterium]MCB9428128.1 hypothetical protein [Actinomycetota bacterium]HPE12952.1 hypothetical protein [Actinomycetota bacterium]